MNYVIVEHKKILLSTHYLTYLNVKYNIRENQIN